MSATAASFYVTGGTLRHNAPSYVERRADRELCDALQRGEFCYVLSSRQMGKSSLMVRTAARLRQEGVQVAIMDLTAIGQNLSAEQWYSGLLGRLGRQLDPSGDLEEALADFWFEQPEHLGRLQRWMAALEQVVLPRCPGQIILFLDEIDAVRSLPFPTSEFFAGIRECYNRRAQDPESQRLTFCLLGVATPTDLIRDTRMTPFNIGRRIDLTDFTEAEAAPLARGLGRDSRSDAALLRRVLYWTGGHPYLTQRLCQAVAADTRVIEPREVDRLCEALFLSNSAQEQDDNLLFVRVRLLRSEADLAGLLDCYRQVQAGKRVVADDTNQLVDTLRLSGITQIVDGRLQVRNPIYARVFNRQWVAAHMPDAELRRQRAAYRRGLWRATGVSGVILVAMGGLALTAAHQARLANQQQHSAERQRRLAEGREQTGRRYLHVAQMNLAQQAGEEGNVAWAQELLAAQRPRPGQEELRGFAWRYLWRLCQGDARFTFRGHGGGVGPVAFSPDGQTLASAGADRTVKLWDVVAHREVATLRGHTGSVDGLAFSPDGRILATGSADRTVKLWEVASRRVIATLKGHGDWVGRVAFSPNGQTLASVSGDRTVKLWNVASRRVRATLKGHTDAVHSVAFSPDGKILATGSQDTTVRLWDAATGRARASLQGYVGPAGPLAFSPDGKILASGGVANTVKLWDVAARRGVASLEGHTAWIGGVAFSPDGRMLATGSGDNTVKLWDLTTKQVVTTFKGHTAPVWGVVFSPSGRLLASGSEDQTLKLWDLTAKRDTTPVLKNGAPVLWVAFSPDGRILATGGDDSTAKLWNVGTRQAVTSFHGHKDWVGGVAFSPNGQILATSSNDGTVKLWELGAGSRERSEPVVTLPAYRRWLGSVAFSPDGKTLATGSDDTTVKLWELAGSREPVVMVASLRGHRGAVVGTAFAPNGKTLASVSTDDTVKLWDAATGRELASLTGWPFPRPPMVFSPDGQLLATGSNANTVELWDIVRQRKAGSLRGYAGGGGAAAFSPDGNTLATSSGSTVSLWNLTIQQEVATLKGHTGPVYSLAFSPDGNTLVSASADGTVRLWRAAPFREADPLRVVLISGSDRAVRLQWQPVPSAVAYQVYRGRRPASTTRAELVKLTPQPVTGVSFTDRGLGLVNGRPQTYGVTALFPDAGGKPVEGPLVTVQGTPVALPPGYLGCSINEGPQYGSAVFDAGTGAITLRGGGADIWWYADGFYFLSRPEAGDFHVTVQALTRPTATDPWAKAGLMVRESLEAGARYGYLLTSAGFGLLFQWRPTTDSSVGLGSKIEIEDTALKLPITLRLTRAGDRVTTEYSRDDGKSFQPAAAPLHFDPPLPKTVYVGLAITAHNARQITEARFRDLRVQKSSR